MRIKSMSLISKLTIIIPTYDRQIYALRNMLYWSGKDVTVHVLDGSLEAMEVNALKEIGTNVKYHHQPGSFGERLKSGIHLTNTEYTVLLGDDEWFLPHGLEACISEMEADKELVSCMGRCLGFIKDQNEVKGFRQYTVMEGYSVFHNDPIERMIFHMNPYTCSTIYSVIRTPVWKLVMGCFAKKIFQVHNIEELQIELATCYLGKSKIIEELMWLRSGENPPMNENGPQLISVVDWWNDSTRKQEREEFFRIMSDTLANGDLNQIEQISNGVRLAMNAFVEGSRETKRKRESLINSLKSAIRSSILRLCPKIVKDPLKEILSKIPFVNYSNGTTLIEAAKDLTESGVRVNLEELIFVNTVIEKFHGISND